MIDWETIVPGRRYLDLPTGDVLVVERVTASRVWIAGRKHSMSIWDFRLRVMPSGRTTASEDRLA